MKQQPPNQASGASETTRFFCTRISPAAGAAGELKQHRKEPDMANRNTNPGIGESVDSGVINTHQPSRARAHARVVRPTGILNESLIDIPGARTRTREERRFHRMAREDVRRRFRSGTRSGRRCRCRVQRQAGCTRPFTLAEDCQRDRL